MLEHGGRLNAAAQRHGIDAARWLDLSTGINPRGWPLRAVPVQAWRRLPQDDDALEAAAARYLGCAAVLATAGSQAAIQALPRLRTPSRVDLLAPSYAEHAHAWREAGHRVREWSGDELRDDTDVLVLVNPNNPTGARREPAQLLHWHRALCARGGWLVVDEAYADACPEGSLAAHAGAPGLIVLRSLGKFFGLAGARVGFVAAEEPLLQALRDRLGPWPIGGAARWLAEHALRDVAWQSAERGRLRQRSARLAAILARNCLSPAGGCALFQWVPTPAAARLEHALARHAVLVRSFAQPSGLRFGLPGTETGWRRLDSALNEIMR
jgi:L-threonine-O-3-phosphate decarboxylase